MKLVQGLLEVCKCPWLCENSERALTERNRVLPAPRFPRCLATARDDIGAGEEGHSMRSACPSVLTRPRPTTDIARLGNLRCSNCFSAGMRHLILWHPRRSDVRVWRREFITLAGAATRCSVFIALAMRIGGRPT